MFGFIVFWFVRLAVCVSGMPIDCVAYHILVLLGTIFDVMNADMKLIMSLHKIYYFRGPVNFRNPLCATKRPNHETNTQKTHFWEEMKCLNLVRSKRDIFVSQRVCLEHPVWHSKRTLYVINFFMVDPTRSSSVFYYLFVQTINFFFLLLLRLLLLLKTKLEFFVLFVFAGFGNTVLCGVNCRPTRCHRLTLSLFSSQHSLLVVVVVVVYLCFDWIGESYYFDRFTSIVRSSAN